MTPPEEESVSGSATKGVVLLQGCIKDGVVGADVSFAKVERMIAAGQIVILKEVFPPDLMLDYRRAVCRWRASTPPYPNGQSPDSTPDVNYHRADKGVIKSPIPHIFQQYGFNTPERLESYVGQPTQLIADLMLGLQNSVAGTRFDISRTGMRVKLLHYPTGGGYLAEHQHPLEPQRVGLIANLSRVGTDFNTGGAYFRTPFGRIDTSAQHDIGDVILFRYDMPHAVAPVDEGRAIDWSSETGRWSFVLELRETYRLSRVK